MGQCDGVSTPADAQLFYLACAAQLAGGREDNKAQKLRT